jgi:hypothetical protein
MPEPARAWRHLGAPIVMLALGLGPATASEKGPWVCRDCAVRSFPVPGHGSLELNIPKEWRSEMRPLGQLPSTISLSPSEGGEFDVMVTPLWSPKNEKDFNSPAKVKTLVDNDRKGLAPSAVEKELVLVPLNGAAAHGYYFFATDKAPKPGEFEYLYRAGVGVGDLLLSVTILTHKKDSQSVQDALASLRDARQRLDDAH